DQHMYQALEKAPGKPLAFTMEEDGQSTAGPERVDRKAREALEKVYRGMPGTEEDVVERYFAIYEQDLPPSRQPALFDRASGEDA
ncbi:MAG: hypothetical protein ACKPKO_07665, partial [Candidatus Fonsibacter sp.]